MGCREGRDQLSGRVLTWFDPAPKERKEELWRACLSSPLLLLRCPLFPELRRRALPNTEGFHLSLRSFHD